MAQIQVKRRSGIIVKWLSERFYGFLEDSETHESYFFHGSKCDFSDIAEGIQISFDIDYDKTKNKPMAINLRR